MAMIEFEDHSEANQRALLAYLDREERTSSRQTCPHCGAVNLFPWVPNVTAYTCRKCGRAVRGDAAKPVIPPAPPAPGTT
jgi:ribosomal protein L37AE/L43A